MIDLGRELTRAAGPRRYAEPVPRPPVTSYDVARTADVSQSTVSRALRDDPRVVPATRERIRQVARQMGYVPHLTARNLITRRASAIAVVTGDLHNPSYPTLIKGLQSVFAAHDHRVLLMSDLADSTSVGDVEALRGGIVDGLVVISPGTDSPLVPEMVRWEMPVVILNREVEGPDAEPVDRVTSDNARGGRLVAEHLWSLGHRRVGLISGPRDNVSVRLREAGFRQWWLARGHPVDDDLVVRGPVDPKTGLVGGTELLQRAHAPTAIFCVTDYVAMGMLDAAKRGGRAVPGDVQVVGYNDLDLAGWSMFDLTTVRQPLEEMARTAALLLLDRIAERAGEPVHRQFGVELVVRGSTAPLH